MEFEMEVLMVTLMTVLLKLLAFKTCAALLPNVSSVTVCHAS
jgi:hypothetical protein